MPDLGAGGQRRTRRRSGDIPETLLLVPEQEARDRRQWRIGRLSAAGHKTIRGDAWERGRGVLPPQSRVQPAGFSCCQGVPVTWSVSGEGMVLRRGEAFSGPWGPWGGHSGTAGGPGSSCPHRRVPPTARARTWPKLQGEHGLQYVLEGNLGHGHPVAAGRPRGRPGQRVSADCGCPLKPAGHEAHCLRM